ncbi:MAG: hypothetical protein IJ593_00075 [Lachnospiraceae bacterium]|nr:hypothetical protein [Lachnospiraceae bacterium]
MNKIIMKNGKELDLDFISETTFGLEPDECTKEENDFWDAEYKKFKEKKKLNVLQ